MDRGRDRQRSLHGPLIVATIALYAVPFIDVALRAVGVPFVTWALLPASWTFQFIRGAQFFGKARALVWVAACMSVTALMIPVALSDPVILISIVVLPVGALVYYLVGRVAGVALTRS